MLARSAVERSTGLPQKDGDSAAQSGEDGSSGVGGARLEGWPPLFPDASVRGEAENIASDVDSLARTQPTSLN